MKRYVHTVPSKNTIVHLFFGTRTRQKVDRSSDFYGRMSLVAIASIASRPLVTPAMSLKGHPTCLNLAADIQCSRDGSEAHCSYAKISPMPL